ncbi:MAG: FAD-linked oxidase C-terminal domain-containing protein [Nocardioidaceae bacterium]
MHRQIRGVFDPSGVLNPGKVLDPEPASTTQLDWSTAGR